MKPFSISKIPYLVFGSGSIVKLSELLLKNNCTKIVLITGVKSFEPEKDRITKLLSQSLIEINHFEIHGEPSPELVDSITEKVRRKEIHAVCAIGGGSVMDAAKAVSAMLCEEETTINFLEGIGTMQPSGKRLPLICVPTTSGTGSEATKNAVLSRIGSDGFKKSLRHDNYVPDISLLDPELTAHCPKSTASASALDALTQLIESYVSTNANTYTDALCVDGLKHAAFALPLLLAGSKEKEVLESIAYAAYISGITLANAGLGVVHGLASPVGAARSVPHGVVCGSTLPAASRLIIERLKTTDSTEARSALEKYSYCGFLLSGNYTYDDEASDSYLETCINKLDEFLHLANLSGLKEYGFTEDDVSVCAKQSSIKNTPVILSTEDIEKIIKTAFKI